MSVVALALALTAPAIARDDAQLWDKVRPEDVATAFKAICLDHPGDAEAQGAAGQAAPWSLRQQGPRDEKGRIGYRTGALQLGATVNGTTNICAITTGLPMNSALTDLALKMSPLLRAGDPTITDTRASWTVQTRFGAKEFGLTMRPAPSLNVTIVTLLIIIDNTKAV